MPESLNFCGRIFGSCELELMRQIAEESSGLAVTEIARTFCELLEWTRPNGGLKNHEWRQLLVQTEGFLQLPAVRKLGGTGPRRPDVSASCSEPAAVTCVAGECGPLEQSHVESKADSRRWREQTERFTNSHVARRLGQIYATGSAITTGNWLVCCGARRLGRCGRGTSGLAGATCSADPTCKDRQQRPIFYSALGSCLGIG